MVANHLLEYGTYPAAPTVSQARNLSSQFKSPHLPKSYECTSSNEQNTWANYKLIKCNKTRWLCSKRCQPCYGYCAAILAGHPDQATPTRTPTPTICYPRPQGTLAPQQLACGNIPWQPMTVPQTPILQEMNSTKLYQWNVPDIDDSTCGPK